MNNYIQITSEIQAKQEIRKQLGRLRCPLCQRQHYVRKLPEGRYFCSSCRHKFSLKALLGFKSCRLTYIQLLRIVHCFATRKTLQSTQDIACISYPTARLAFSRLRTLLPDKQGQLAGDIITDVMYVGRQKTDNQVLVTGAVDRAFTEIRLRIIPDQEQHTLEQFLCDYVNIGSMITTDHHLSYNDIEWYGYGHQSENHEKFQLKLSVPIERVWALFKTLIRRTYHHIWKEKLPEYLGEFKARFNHHEIFQSDQCLLTYLLQPCSKSFT